MTWSQWLHWKIYKDDTTSLCGRAWAKRHEDVFWLAWVIVFTPRHCREAAEWHEKRVRGLL